MASFSSSLEQALRRALQYANQRSHEYATLEHLLLSLLDDRDAAAVMRACDVDIDLLRDKLTGYLDNELAGLVLDSHNDAQPTAGFQRVIHRAVAHVQSSGREEVTGANVLVAIFAERESHAAFFLQEQHMTRFDAVNYISHGIAKRAGMSEPRTVRGVEEDAATVEGGDEKKRGADALEVYCINLNQKARAGRIDPLIGRGPRSSAPSRCFAGGRRTTRCSWATPASARPQSPRASRAASSWATCLRCSPNPPSSARHGRAARRHPLPRRFRGAAEGGDAARSRPIPAPSCSSTRSTR